MRTFAFKIYDNDIEVICYKFDSKEKAENWQSNYINDMKKMDTWPLKGIRTKVEQL